MDRRRVAAAGVAGAAGLLAWPFVEPQLPVLRRVAVPVLAPGGEPIRVLHLSDLHLLPRHRRRARWVAALTRCQADLVVSTGDHLSSAESIPLLADTLGALTADGTPGVFVPGNNDYYTPTRPSPLDYLRGGSRPLRRAPDLPWDEAVQLLERAGWTDLTHRRVTLRVAGRPVVLTGTDDAHLRRDRYGRASGIVARPDGELALGVTHTPETRLLRSFAADQHDLVLAGHTHGGQLRLPRLGPLVTNCDLPRWRARGLTRDRTGWLHVSAGLGQSPYLPVRVCCRPEATLLELVPRAADDGVR